MKKYLEWGAVQRQLTEHAALTGRPYSFYEAAIELWQRGEYLEAEELPKVPFEQWRIADLDQLRQLLDRTPVDLQFFEREFEAKVSPKAALRHALSVEGAPIPMAADQTMGIHAHDFFRILYAVKGETRLVTERSSIHLPENSLCILSPDFYHDTLVGQDSILLSMVLTEEVMEDTLYQLLDPEDILAGFFHSGLGGGQSGCLIFHPEEKNQFLGLYRILLHECYTKGEYSRNVYISTLQILFARLLRGASSHELDRQYHRPAALPMLPILKYIQDHYQQTSLEEVAELFHYSPSYLGKQIKAATGRNFVEMVRDLRIREAKVLLADTDLPMDTVAAQAGFDSRVHFFRCFRTAMGMTPGQWRKQAGVNG